MNGCPDCEATPGYERLLHAHGIDPQSVRAVRALPQLFDVTIRCIESPHATISFRLMGEDVKLLGELKAARLQRGVAAMLLTFLREVVR